MNQPYVPIEDVAKHFSVSVSTVRSWLRQGRVPKNSYIEVGNTRRFSIAALASGLAPKTADKAPVFQVDSESEEDFYGDM